MKWIVNINYFNWLILVNVYKPFKISIASVCVLVSQNSEIQMLKWIILIKNRKAMSLLPDRVSKLELPKTYSGS